MIILRKMIDELTYTSYIVFNYGISLKINVGQKRNRHLNVVRESGSMNILTSQYSNKCNFILPLGLLIVTTVLWYLGYSKAYFIKSDAYDYAQMGRELFAGHGFTTAQIFPRHIPYMAKEGHLIDDIGHWPNLYRCPLPTIADAAFQFLIRDDVIAAAIYQSGFWCLLCIPLLFTFAKKLTNSTVAFLSSVFYLAGKSFWLSSYNGMSESLAIFLVLLLFYLIFCCTSNAWQWLLVGIVCGLVFLTRTQLVFLLPFAIMFAWIKSSVFPVRNIALVILGMLIVTAPWAARNSLLTGDPLFSFSTSRNLVLGTSEVHSDLEMQLHAPVQMDVILGTYGASILTKVLHNLWPRILSPSNVVGSPIYAVVVGIAILLSFLPGRTDGTYGRDYALFKWGTLAIIVVNFLIVSFAFSKERFFLAFHPLISIIGFKEVCRIPQRFGLNRIPYFRTALALILLGGCVFYLLRTVQGFIPSRSAQSRKADQRICDALSNITGKKSVIASDVSFKLTLYNGNPTVRLPAFPEQLLEINNKYITIDYVLLSAPIVQTKPLGEAPSLFEKYSSYGNFINTRAFTEMYQCVARLPDGSTLYSRIDNR
jgi:4-amino-4-deoxy-L-arabinose transferase-like glycosyltransferase